MRKLICTACGESIFVENNWELTGATTHAKDAGHSFAPVTTESGRLGIPEALGTPGHDPIHAHKSNSVKSHHIGCAIFLLLIAFTLVAIIAGLSDEGTGEVYPAGCKKHTAPYC